MSITSKTPLLLCEKYWANQIKSLPEKTLNSSTVRDHNYISHLNSCCLLSDKLEKKYVDSHVIKSVDIDFKYLPKLKKDIVLWRGIPKYHPLKTPYLRNLYENIEFLKKGDTYINRAYMYGAVEKDIAESFRHNWQEEGLLIKMNIPEGAQISLTNFEGITPRYSKWICINNEPIKDGHLIELQYVLPEDNFKKHSFKNRVINFVNSIKNICKFIG